MSSNFFDAPQKRIRDEFNFKPHPLTSSALRAVKKTNGFQVSVVKLRKGWQCNLFKNLSNGNFDVFVIDSLGNAVHRNPNANAQEVLDIFFNL
jgi:hypothetical protein